MECRWCLLRIPSCSRILREGIHRSLGFAMRQLFFPTNGCLAATNRAAEFAGNILPWNANVLAVHDGHNAAT
jgi:hypothetical protein